jgi:predicted AAA+ superfamily ATPase
VNDYLKEEIIAEALVQNVPAFSEFLRIAALSSSEILDYSNVANEAGVSSKVVRTYFDILEQTFLGFRIPPWKKSNSRRMILTDKFYLFDVGVTQFLARRNSNPGTPDFGKAFEQLILMELRAYQAYRDPELPITFWRTSTGQEVDFILGQKELAIEIKASTRLRKNDLTSLAILQEDGLVKRRIVVSLEREQRRLLEPPYKGIEIWPWQEFVTALWAGEFL